MGRKNGHERASMRTAAALVVLFAAAQGIALAAGGGAAGGGAAAGGTGGGAGGGANYPQPPSGSGPSSPSGSSPSSPGGGSPSSPSGENPSASSPQSSAPSSAAPSSSGGQAAGASGTPGGMMGGASMPGAQTGGGATTGFGGPMAGDAGREGVVHGEAYYRGQIQGGNAPPAPTSDTALPAAVPAEGDAGAAREPAGIAMSLADAKTNFVTVVNTFVQRHSSDGYWRAAGSGTRKAMKLKIKSIDKESLTGGDGEALHTGRVLMITEGRAKSVPVDFTVDFTGDDWKVVKYAFPAAGKNNPPR